MFTRLLKKPKRSSFLFGPRSTGKSTWIKLNFPNVIIYNLLDTNEALRLSKNPSIVFHELNGLKEGSWAIIDEVQKVPRLLDEVHRLMEERKINFILSGSSARKIKRGASNLLGGRARLLNMFPLVSAEVNFDLNLQKILQYGMLPVAYTDEDPKSYLIAYSNIYLQEEIKGEAIAQNIGNFARFLEIAARQNGQVTSIAGISRDAMVARQTVQGYFDILSDTLIGSWLPAWKLKRSTKQISHPKFYFFDPGVARVLSGRIEFPPSSEEAGHLFETLILGEIRAYLSYSNLAYTVYFWSSHDGVEVDILLEDKNGYVAIEIKVSKNWDKKFNKGLLRISDELGKKKVRTIGIYTGERRAVFDHIKVMPFIDFLRDLWSGEIIK